MSRLRKGPQQLSRPRSDAVALCKDPKHLLPIPPVRIEVGKEGGGARSTPPSVKSSNFDYPNGAPPERAAQYGVYRKSHWVQDVPLAYSAPDSTQDGQGIQEERSFPWVVINFRSY